MQSPLKPTSACLIPRLFLHIRIYLSMSLSVPSLWHFWLVCHATSGIRFFTHRESPASPSCSVRLHKGHTWTSYELIVFAAPHPRRGRFAVTSISYILSSLSTLSYLTLSPSCFSALWKVFVFARIIDVLMVAIVSCRRSCCCCCLQRY